MALPTPRTTPRKNQNGLSDAQAGSYAPLYLSCDLGKASLDIEVLEDLGKKRLRVLKAGDLARAQAAAWGPGVPERVKVAIRQAEREEGLKVPEQMVGEEREDRVLSDEASHFLLRLALCSTAEQRAWFLAREYDLFVTRLDGTGIKFALKTIERANGPQIRPVVGKEFEELKSDLEAVERGVRRAHGEVTLRYYKVRFEEVASLVKGRRVLIRGGMAYVPERNIMDVVASQFRAKLSQSLATASRSVSYAENDKRMLPILETIRAFHAADSVRKHHGFDTSRGSGGESISLAELDQAISSMPLCMSNMMAALREQHHLRYAARLQLGAFLKGCGLTMEESLQFWQTEFGKGHIGADKFQKNYAYNIRHQYGKEGRRRSLTPYSCMKVINERPGPGEHHGCPFREFEESRLKAAVQRAGADAEAAKEIVSKARDGHFQIACGMCFRATQPGPGSATEASEEYVPTHPNEYFIEARRRRMRRGVQNTTGNEAQSAT